MGTNLDNTLEVVIGSTQTYLQDGWDQIYVSVNEELSYLGLSLMVTRETASSAWHDETEARW